jgi:signal transduction histidine kinase
MRIGLFLEYILICLNLILVFVVFSNDFKNPLKRSFSLFVFGSVVWIFCANIVFVGKNMFFTKPTLLGAEVMILGFIFLAQYFPSKDKKEIKNNKTFFAFLIPWILIFLFTFSRFVIDLVDTDNDGYPNIIRGILFWARFLIMFFYATWSIYVFIKKYKELPLINKNGIFRLILFGSLLALSVLISDFFLFTTLNSFVIVLGVVFSFLFILSMAYSIARNEFVDMNIVLKKGVLYTISIFIISIVYFTFSFLFEDFLSKNDNIFHSLSGVSASVFCTVGFFYFKKDIENITDKIFFRGEYNHFLAINKFGEISSSAKDLDGLASGINEIFSETIKPSSFVLFIIKTNQIYFYKNNRREDSSTISDLYQNVTRDFNDIFTGQIFIKELKNNFNNLSEKARKKYEILISLCEKENISSIIPIYLKENLISVLFIGHRRSGKEYFSQQDKILLSAISFEAGITIENIALYSGLQQYTDELNKKFIAKTEKIKNMYNSQSNFLADMSHEFQTPISILKGNLECLERKDKSKNKAEFYTIETTLDRLSRLINNLLMVSRLNSPNGKLKKNRINIYKLLERTYDDCVILTKNKGINFSFSSERCFIVGYEDKLREVLLNLISNALKYTNAGGSIFLSGKIVNDEVEIKVSDTGVGISKKNIPRIFERFYKIENNSYSGTGLGLYICKQIIEAHDGYIYVKSVLGKGSDFIIMIPRQKNN